MNDPELHQLAEDIAERRVFGTWQLQDRPDDAGLIFAPLGFLDPVLIDTVKASAHIYEYLSRAAPRTWKGMPTFTSFMLLSHEDWAKLAPMVNERLASSPASSRSLIGP